MSNNDPTDHTAPSVLASAFWSDHFRRNQDAAPKIDPHGPSEMTDEQRRVIGGSIAEFERGERSEGRHLMTFARLYAERAEDPDYVTAMGLFVAEENRHARYLECCMRREGMQQTDRTAADSVFRWARKLAGLELSIMVLVTAEIIAQVYYRGLRDASSSVTLKRVCKQILADEKHHIRFQCERLAMIRQRRSRVTIWRRRWAHRAMMAGAILVVWHNHRAAMRLGGFTFTVFRRQVWAKLQRAMRIADPKGYAWAPDNRFAWM